MFSRHYEYVYQMADRNCYWVGICGEKVMTTDIRVGIYARSSDVGKVGINNQHLYIVEFFIAFLMMTNGSLDNTSISVEVDTKAFIDHHFFSSVTSAADRKQCCHKRLTRHTGPSQATYNLPINCVVMPCKSRPEPTQYFSSIRCLSPF